MFFARFERRGLIVALVGSCFRALFLVVATSKPGVNFSRVKVAGNPRYNTPVGSVILSPIYVFYPVLQGVGTILRNVVHL